MGLIIFILFISKMKVINISYQLLLYGGLLINHSTIEALKL